MVYYKYMNEKIRLNNDNFEDDRRKKRKDTLEKIVENKPRREDMRSREAFDKNSTVVLELYNKKKGVKNITKEDFEQRLIDDPLMRTAIMAMSNNEIEKNREISTHRIEKRKERMDASKDDLTGLYNRKKFDEILNKVFKTTPLENFKNQWVAHIDFDNFKVVNSGLGEHSAGDYALQKVSDVFKKSLRDRDILARYGGDEFRILMRDSSQKEVLNIMERLRKNVEEEIIKYKISENIERDIPVTVSIGVAPFFGDKTEDSMQASDLATAFAKGEKRELQEGEEIKNQIWFYSPENKEYLKHIT